MSSIDLSAFPAAGMSLGDLIAEVAFNNENMAPAPVAEVANGATNETPTKAKKPRKTPVKKVKGVDGENGGPPAEGAAEEPTTPKAVAPKKRGPKKKVEPATPNGGAEDGDVEPATPFTNGTTKSSGKKRGPAMAANGETPTKKAKAATGETPKRGKAGAVKFPECWAEFTPEDKLIVTMRKEGKAWIEIEAAWTELTGRKPGTDVTRKRFTKLEAVAQDFKDEDLPMLCNFKKVVDEETEVAIKKVKADAWVKIGERIKAAGGDDYKGPAIEKKFFWLKKNGKLTESGNYIQPAVEEMENLSVGDGTNGKVVEAEAEAEPMEE